MELTHIPAIPTAITTPNAGGLGMQTSRGVAVVASAGTPVPLTATALAVSSVTLTGYKAAHTANAGVIFIQYGDAAAGIPGVPLEAGKVQNVSSPDGKLVRLDQLYIDAATSGDGVCWTAHY